MPESYIRSCFRRRAPLSVWMVCGGWRKFIAAKSRGIYLYCGLCVSEQYPAKEVSLSAGAGRLRAVQGCGDYLCHAERGS